MRLGTSFHQTQVQTQKQLLTPRMIQAMEVLQLPLLALQERVDLELEENPVLEVNETTEEAIDLEVEELAPSPDAPTEDEKALVITEDSDNSADFERLAEIDASLPETYEERRPSSNEIERLSDRKLDAMANIPTKSQTLQEYLTEQLHWIAPEAPLQELTERLIYNLDGKGYLSTSLEAILGEPENDAQKEEQEKALRLLQSFDPTGVGARDLKECLLLQITDEFKYAEELRRLISDHLDDITHNRMPAIVKATDWDIEFIEKILTQVRLLTARPCSEFTDEAAQAITPDLFAERDEEGRYRIRLVEGDIPTLFINAEYRRILQDKDATEEAKDYIKKKINSAQWLIEAIQQRCSTLTNVAQAVLDHQTEFFERGEVAIAPLKMQQIADQVGVHVTTISRAVDGKWMQTPRGIYPLRRFFTAGIENAEGEEIARDTVKSKLQEMINAEDKKHPLSDEALEKAFAEIGLTVARRTIAKYRTAMGIPSSRGRRKWSD